MKTAESITGVKHVESMFIVERKVIEVDVDAPVGKQSDSVVNGVESFHAQDVKFEQAHGFESGERVSANIIVTLPFDCAKVFGFGRENNESRSVNTEMLNNAKEFIRQSF